MTPALPVHVWRRLSLIPRRYNDRMHRAARSPEIQQQPTHVHGTIE